MEASTTNPLERRLDLSVAIADIEKEVDKQLRRLGKNAKMPGFRPGKIPMNILKQQYGEQAHHDAFNEVLNRVFMDAVKAGDYQIVGRPQIEPKQTESTTHVEVTAIFEVYPEIVLNDLAGAEIERPTLEIADAQIDKTIEILRQQRVRHEAANRAAAKDDRVVIDFSGKKNGEPFEGGAASDYPLVLGQGTLLADFEKALEGMKAGESKTIDVKFPDDYFAKDMAGQTANFEITLKQVMAPVLPVVDAEFAKNLGIKDGDLTKMREEIAANLKREVKRRIETQVKTQVMDALLKANPVNVPKALIEMEIQRMRQNLVKELERSGMKTNDFPMQDDLFVEQATRRISLGIIVAEVIKAEKLEAQPQQVRAAIEDMAESYERPDELIRWYFAQPKRLAEVEDVVSENNVVAWVLSKAKVTDKEADFDELMGRKTN
ncbi:MAG: Trigger factor [Proteobacteria bacterium]|nr:Trigger factor [Pseudomonadota bacterium]